MGRLDGKTAFITAAGAGIGRATAIAFSREGARVIATDIDAEALDSLAAQADGLRPAILDMRDTAAVAAAAADAGRVDILFNCAGYVHHGTVLDCDEAAWDHSFDLNVKSIWRSLRSFLPAMIEGGGGSVINVASAASSIKGVPDRFAYAATKAAVIGLTKSLAADFVARGVRANAICPGTVQSPSLEARISALPGSYAENRAAFVARQPMGRIAMPEEIAALAVFLASDESAFVTGAEFRIDGGWTL